jgi:hypothetical protein
VSLTVETPTPVELPEDDLYPEDRDAQKKLATFVQNRFQVAERARQPYETTWLRYYKAYRSYRKQRKPGQWKNNLWIPITFTIIETILPRIAAALPSAKVNPIGPEDVEPARTLEELLKWAEDKSELYPEQVKAVKSALMYGTGVLKVSVKERKGGNVVEEPVLEERTFQVATGEMDIDNNPLMMTQQEQVPRIDPATGQPMTTKVYQEYTEYLGPQAECVDIEQFFPDPLGDDVQSCRWVIQRVYRDRAHMEEMFSKGVYRLPDYVDSDEWWKKIDGSITYAKVARLNEVELGPGSVDEEVPKDLFPVLEMWRKGVNGVELITVAGERGEGVLLRHVKSPFFHGLFPYVRVVDHIVPHEFWGIGEVEPVESIQEALNQLWNARLDNVKISLNQMFAVVMDYLESPSDLIVRPGGIVRMKEGLPLEQVFKQIDLGDVTASAYQEGEKLDQLAQFTSGVSPYQTGQDSPAYNRTATGVAIISEQGNTRFSFKVQLAEHTAYKHLVRMYAALLQQYVPDDLVLRINGGEAEMQQQQAMMMAQQMAQTYMAQGMDPMMAQQAAMQAMPQFDPMAGWQKITPDAISGRFDFQIEAESSAQTLSMRREQTLSRFQTFQQDPYIKPRPIRKDTLEELGVKNVDDYLLSDMEIQMMQMQAAAQQSTPEEGGQ